MERMESETDVRNQREADARLRVLHERMHQHLAEARMGHGPDTDSDDEGEKEKDAFEGFTAFGAELADGEAAQQTPMGSEETTLCDQYAVVSKVEHDLLRAELEQAFTELAAARNAAKEMQADHDAEVESLAEQNQKLTQKLQRAVGERHELEKEMKMTGPSKFNFQKKIMMQKRSLQREQRAAQRRWHDLLAAQETSLMHAEDTQRRQPPLRMGSGASAISEEGGDPQRVWFGGPASPREYLELYSVDLSTPNDDYVAAKVGGTALGETVAGLQALARGLLKAAKAGADETLCHIERMLWPPVAKCQQPRAVYGRLARQSMLKSKMLVADGARKMNERLLEFVAAEGAAKVKWGEELAEAARARSRECGAQTDADRGHTELELKLIGETAALKARVEAASLAATRQRAAHKREVDKLCLNLGYLQEKATVLAKELYRNLHLVWKHRFRWIGRHVDPLVAFTKSKASRKAFSGTEFNYHLGDMLLRHTEQLQKFGNYFTRSDQFGTDMSAKDAKEASKEAARRGSAGGPARPGARRGSGSAPTLRRRSLEGGPPVAGAARAVVDNLRRSTLPLGPSEAAPGEGKPAAVSFVVEPPTMAHEPRSPESPDGAPRGPRRRHSSQLELPAPAAEWHEGDSDFKRPSYTATPPSPTLSPAAPPRRSVTPGERSLRERSRVRQLRRTSTGAAGPGSQPPSPRRRCG
eukprot:TRINITY_DN2775_c0_g1_i1.p1 TRINITY_DN2775_c0_g1~~TRINITY_DN2775_c0_g1_i1.p1  ORF type:complete len:700 (+),score=265.48 TRINITY_DN2775_c0_g1_i1:66-2165(+)